MKSTLIILLVFLLKIGVAAQDLCSFGNDDVRVMPISVTLNANTFSIKLCRHHMLNNQDIFRAVTT